MSFRLMFETKAERSVESVNEAFLRETGDSDWGYNSLEDIERAERDGFLEFDNGIMRVFADMN